MYHVTSQAECQGRHSRWTQSGTSDSGKNQLRSNLNATESEV
ncbi:hypothetical protein Nmel_011251 [Mimus melanotis]